MCIEAAATNFYKRSALKHQKLCSHSLGARSLKSVSVSHSQGVGSDVLPPEGLEESLFLASVFHGCRCSEAVAAALQFLSLVKLSSSVCVDRRGQGPLPSFCKGTGDCMGSASLIRDGHTVLKVFSMKSHIHRLQGLGLTL